MVAKTVAIVLALAAMLAIGIFVGHDWKSEPEISAADAAHHKKLAEETFRQCKSSFLTDEIQCEKARQYLLTH